MSRYAKLIVALIGSVPPVLAALGVDVSITEPTIQAAAVSLATAFGVYKVPNKK